MKFHEELKKLMHQYVKRIYQITRKFPKEEMFGATSQVRRAAMSMILNYIEGYARRRGDMCKVYRNFLETSYGSIKESEYIVFFAYTENWINILKRVSSWDIEHVIPGHGEISDRESIKEQIQYLVDSIINLRKI